MFCPALAQQAVGLYDVGTGRAPWPTEIWGFLVRFGVAFS